MEFAGLENSKIFWHRELADKKIIAKRNINRHGKLQQSLAHLIRCRV